MQNIAGSEAVIGHHGRDVGESGYGDVGTESLLHSDTDQGNGLILEFDPETPGRHFEIHGQAYRGLDDWNREEGNIGRIEDFALTFGDEHHHAAHSHVKSQSAMGFPRMIETAADAGAKRLN